MSNDLNRPDRCQALTQYGQCTATAVEGKTLCPYHLRDRNAEDKLALRGYILANTEWSQSAVRHSQAEELKSLREEISLCRAMIERYWNTVETNTDFLAQSGKINALFLTLDKLITSCHRLEVNLGNLLSKAALLELAREIVDILMCELENIDNYEEIVDRISDRIVTAITQQGQK